MDSLVENNELNPPDNGGIEMRLPGDPGPQEAAPAAPAPQEQMNAEAKAGLENVARHSQAAEYDARQAATQHAEAVAASEGVQANAIRDQAAAETKLNNELGGPGGILENHAHQMQVLQKAQEQYMQDAAETLADYRAKEAEHLKKLQNYVNRAPPHDLWGAAGVNPILGRIAVMMSSFSQAGQLLAGKQAGPNQSFEYFKSLAAMRAQQYADEGENLRGQGSELARLHAGAREDLGSAQVTTQHIQASLERSLAAQIQYTAAKYKNPQIQATAQQEIGKLMEHAAQLDQQGTQQGLQTRLHALSVRESVYSRLAAADGHVKNQAEVNKIKEGAAATEQAIKLIRELKKTDNPVRRQQLQAELAPILMRAETPGSNRVLTGPQKATELSKLGGAAIPEKILGVPVPFGGVRFGGDLDQLEKNLLDVQKQRDIEFGTNTTQEIEKRLKETPDAIMQNAPLAK